MIEVTDQTFGPQVEQASRPVLVDFHATWCGPCQALRPLLEQFESSRPDLDIVGVDFDRAPNVAVRYGVRSLPTLILFRGGKAIGQRVGGPGSMAELARMVDAALAQQS